MNPNFSAALLAGGKSTRMGRNKALIEIDGLPLWQRQLRILEELKPGEIFISGEFDSPGYTSIPDAQINAGPLGGIVASLRHCSTPLLVVLAVDLPKIRAAFLRGLLTDCSNDRGAMAMIDDRFEPLAAVYPRTALPVAERQLASGEYSLQVFCRDCVNQRLVRQMELADDQKPLFRNLNAPADLIDMTTRL